MAGTVIAGQTGVQALGDGVTTPPRLIRTGELGVSEVHGRFYEQVYRGNVYSIGTTVTALSANTITLTATTTPILGIWNPLTSTVNAVLLQCALQVVINTLTTPAGGGAFVWASSVGNVTITPSGTAPFNRKTMSSQGSQVKGYGLSGAGSLSGLINNLVIFDAADFVGTTALANGTISATQGMMVSAGGVQNFDGSLFVPPGGVLALLNTTSTTAMSVSGRLMWEEVPL